MRPATASLTSNPIPALPTALRHEPGDTEVLAGEEPAGRAPAGIVRGGGDGPGPGVHSLRTLAVVHVRTVALAARPVAVVAVVQAGAGPALVAALQGLGLRAEGADGVGAERQAPAEQRPGGPEEQQVAVGHAEERPERYQECVDQGVAEQVMVKALLGHGGG